ncbi:MAG: phosphoribosylanthranilate isomerase, partial [Verrucomicrobiales bacterium]|nr:phosphoribosylanthranilate isomerase [Verrucomicrobiales bacterium]
REILGDTPLILSGGLVSANVAEAIQKVRPHAVDVASGVESAPGVKSKEMIADFLQTVRSA